MTIATRAPFQPADFAEWLNAHDDFHQVGMQLEKRVAAQRSESGEYSLRVIVTGGKLYFADFVDGPVDGVEYKDGVYQPIGTGSIDPAAPDYASNDTGGEYVGNQ